MKTLYKFLFTFFIAFFFVANVFAGTVKIKKVISDQNGCKWTINGTATYTVIPPKLTSFDIWATDCNGNSYHFVGTLSSSSSDGSNLERDFSYSFNIVSCSNNCNDNSKFFLFEQIKNE